MLQDTCNKISCIVSGEIKFILRISNLPNTVALYALVELNSPSDQIRTWVIFQKYICCVSFYSLKDQPLTLG